MVRAWFLIALALAGCGGKKTTDKRAVFWKWFTDHAAALHDDKDLTGVMNQISAELEKVEHGVFAEIGGGEPRLLVISADGDRKLFPAVEALYATHPTVPGWNIVAFRQRTTPGEAGMQIELGDKTVAPADLKFTATTAGDKLDIVV